ncbi:MAG: tyrosine-type recombinase/integrase [Acidobacteria bacterium]|nr:tyrosine-type recombinase/integrase [Acidobacteriota bacterium]
MTALGLTFHSVLAEPITIYVKAKCTIGCRFAGEARALRLFDRFLVAQRVATVDAISRDVIDAFLASRPRPEARSDNDLLGTVRRFFELMMAQQVLRASPVRATRRREGPCRRPFLFNMAQMRQLLEMSRLLPDRNRGPRRGPTYYAIFAVLYGLGLRIGEVSRLTVGDLDLERRVLWIRNSKFGKSRLVPFGPRLESVLRMHVEQSRHAQQRSPAAPLFTFNGHRGVSPNSIRNAFRDHLIPRLGFVVPPGTRRPRVHDLRHSFAVGALLRWYRAGVDPAVRLPHLSTFLGHINPSATAVYLTMTEELLDEANRRFSTFAPHATAEVTP